MGNRPEAYLLHGHARLQVLGEYREGLVLEVVEGGDAPQGEGLNLALLLHGDAARLLEIKSSRLRNSGCLTALKQSSDDSGPVDLSIIEKRSPELGCARFRRGVFLKLRSRTTEMRVCTNVDSKGVW